MITEYSIFPREKKGNTPINRSSEKKIMLVNRSRLINRELKRYVRNAADETPDFGDIN